MAGLAAGISRHLSDGIPDSQHLRVADTVSIGKTFERAVDPFHIQDMCVGGGEHVSRFDLLYAATGYYPYRPEIGAHDPEG